MSLVVKLNRFKVLKFKNEKYARLEFRGMLQFRKFALFAYIPNSQLKLTQSFLRLRNPPSSSFPFVLLCLTPLCGFFHIPFCNYANFVNNVAFVCMEINSFFLYFCTSTNVLRIVSFEMYNVYTLLIRTRLEPSCSN